jgi:hypothetical protein
MKFYLFLLTIIFGAACTSQKNAKMIELDFNNPPTYVYKTKADYSKNVPVLLSEDKTKIIAYPAPTDVYYNGKLAYPTELSKNYLLDNRGIGLNVAFLKMTYEEYSQLKEVPSLKVLFDQIIDNDPLIELCNCGNRNQFNDIEVLNQLVKKNLSKCKKLK